MWGLRQHTLLAGIVVGFMWDLGQHNLLDIVVWFTWASGNTHCWVLLLVYVGTLATHFTGIIVWFTWSSGNAHYWVLLLLYVGPRATHSQTKSHATTSLFPDYTNLPQSDKSHALNGLLSPSSSITMIAECNCVDDYSMKPF
jgi:hypothetical protein